MCFYVILWLNLYFPKKIRTYITALRTVNVSWKMNNYISISVRT